MQNIFININVRQYTLNLFELFFSISIRLKTGQIHGGGERRN